MKVISLILTLSVFGLIPMTSFAAEYDFKPGLWQIESVAKMEGMQGNMSQEKTEECIKGTNAMFVSDDDCKYNKQHVSEQEMLVDIMCTGPDGTTVKGKAEYNFNGETANASIKNVIKRKSAKPMEITITMEGRYLGECKE